MKKIKYTIIIEDDADKIQERWDHREEFAQGFLEVCDMVDLKVTFDMEVLPEEALANDNEEVPVKESDAA